MVKFTFAAILAASIAAPVLGAAISFDRLESREVAASPEELFGRAVAEVFNDVYSRDELSELMGRDIAEFTTRELSELMSREYDVDESLITRDLLDFAELDAREPIFKWIKKKLGFGGNAAAAAAEQQQARDFEDELLDSEAREFEDDVFERDSMEDHDLEARAPIFKWIKKKLGFGGNAAAAAEQQQARDFDEDTLDARDFDEEMFEARAETPAPAPKQPNIIEKFLNLFRNKNHAGAKAAAAKKNAGEAPAPAAAAPEAAPATEAAPAARDFLDIPEERSYDDEEMFERDFENVFETEERDVEDDMMERDFDEDVYERDFEDEVYERDYDVEELLERIFEEEVFEREYEDVLERDYEVDELD